VWEAISTGKHVSEVPLADAIRGFWIGFAIGFAAQKAGAPAAAGAIFLGVGLLLSSFTADTAFEFGFDAICWFATFDKYEFDKGVEDVKGKSKKLWNTLFNKKPEGAPNPKGGVNPGGSKPSGSGPIAPGDRPKLTTDEKSAYGRMIKNGDLTEEDLKDVLHPDDLEKLFRNVEKRYENKVLGKHDPEKIVDDMTKSENNYKLALENWLRNKDGENAEDALDKLNEAEKQVSQLRAVWEQLRREGQ